MRLGPATTIVLAMFGSFAVVLTAMIVLMKPGKPRQTADRTPHPVKTVQEPGQATVTTPGSAADSSSVAATESPATVEDRDRETEATQPAARRSSPRGATPRRPAAGRELQRKLEQEQKEVRLLKAEMERRLRAQVAEREAKLDKLAESCAALSAGEAAQVLAELDDGTIVAVLKRMDRKAALGIAAVLQRLGRKDATAF